MGLSIDCMVSDWTPNGDSLQLFTADVQDAKNFAEFGNTPLAGSSAARIHLSPRVLTRLQESAPSGISAGRLFEASAWELYHLDCKGSTKHYLLAFSAHEADALIQKGDILSNPETIPEVYAVHPMRPFLATPVLAQYALALAKETQKK